MIPTSAVAWKILRRLVTTLLANFFAQSASAQVSNDNIEHRRVLRAEETISSSTTSTMEPERVDERLTGKCIQ